MLTKRQNLLETIRDNSEMLLRLAGIVFLYNC